MNDLKKDVNISLGPYVKQTLNWIKEN